MESDNLPSTNSSGEEELCFQATGTIEGKFDSGYLVSVKIGFETLNGVLYQPNTDIVPYTSQNHHQNQAQEQQFLHSESQPHQSKRKRKGRDPNRPKPNRSGYNFFFAERHSLLKTMYPNREREFTKMIGESWNNLSPEERTIYQNHAMQDKERYHRELREYRERLNIVNTS